jgi:hypothetical protein
MLSLAVLWTGSLWFASAVHLGWNWATAAVLDLPVSGLDSSTRPSTTAQPVGPAWLTGGEFGPEGGLAGTLAVAPGHRPHLVVRPSRLAGPNRSRKETIMSKIDRVGVVGGGTMGNGIAHVFAQHGHPVVLVDVDQERLAGAVATIRKNLERQAKKGLLEETAVEEIVGRIEIATDSSRPSAAPTWSSRPCPRSSS